METSKPTLTRRELLVLAGCVGASTLAPAAAFAEEDSDPHNDINTPPNPERMLTSVEEPAASTFSAGPSWSTSEVDANLKAFLDGNANTYLDPAYKVIDVSEHNGVIDWNTVKESGVDGAIIRLGFGSDRADYQLKNNITACNTLGIPYGVYLYSYAYNATMAADEANFTADLIEQYGCTPKLPVFYDLEKWVWTGHEPPSDVKTYDAIVRQYCSTLSGRGYNNVRVYSYRSYLNDVLKSDYIWERAAWAAEYGSATLKFENPYFDGCLAWQYTSTGAVSGVAGNVDINAFPPFYKFAFGDVTAKTEHHEDIWWLAGNDISTGFPDGTFRGMSAVARQDMAAFLYRIAGSPSYTPSAEDKRRFIDVTSDTPHCKEVWWLGHTGVSTGFPDGTFRGMSAVARQDMAAFLYRIAGSPSYTPSAEDKRRFIDVTSDTPHCKEVWWLGHTGVSTGFPDGTFRGMSAVARQDMAAFLKRIHGLMQ